MQYTEKELKEILDNHLEWLRNDTGVRANLSRADLSGADLSGANLSGADLFGANLSRADLFGADLFGANLSRANLYRADLSGANLQDTILANINWLAYIGIVPDSKNKARAYKVTTAEGEGVYNGGINYAKKKIFEANLNTDVNQQCASGVNLATFAWCLNEKQEDRRLFLIEFDASPKNICVPVGSDGKFRVAKCYKVGECDWQGNLSSSNK